MKITYLSNILLIVLLSCIQLLLYADDHSNAMGTGMSRASLISSSGIDAYGINPANFDYSQNEIKLKNTKKQEPTDNTVLNFSLMSVGGTYGCDSNMNFYNNYLKYLSVNRQTFTGLFTDFAKLLDFRANVLPNERTQVNYDFELKWLSFNVSNNKWGSVNITVADKVGLNTNAFGRNEAMPLNFNYLPLGNGKFQLTNLEIRQSEATAWWIRKYTLGYAKKFKFDGFIKSFSIGISGGLVHGFGNIITYDSYIRGDTYYSQQTSGTHIDSIKGYQDFRTQSALTDFFRDYQDGARSHFTFFPKPAGKGYCIDVGFTMQLGKYFTLASSVTDIGSIKWDYNTYINFDRESFAYYNFNLNATDPTYNRFVNDLEGLDTRDSVTPYSTSLPTKYRAGIQYKNSDKFLVEFDYIRGDNNLPGNANADVFTLGSEYYVLPFLPLRAGFSAGGPGGWYAALGAGLRFKSFTLDLGTNGINQLIKNSRISFSLSAKLIL